ncbi:MAG TPA: hypothetical protein VME46_02100 [Acidimicrobiales bacterium]|nr:hypothetical protein [Acidimicrobiales bacterium]
MTGTIVAPRVGPRASPNVPEEASQDGQPVPYATGARPSPRVVLAHVLTLAIAVGVWAYWDRNLWFFGDEWDFLTRRGLHGATFSLWAPHNEHWSVLPILLWRAIFSLWHLTSYWPYLLPVLIAHAAIVHLLWRRFLYEGASPWLATGLGLLFALFGTGAEDLAWAFQIGFVSSLALGLLALDAADGPHLWRPPVLKNALARDAFVAALLLASLMCSDVGVAVGVAVGVLMLARRGWARATRVLVVPVAVYVTWFATSGHRGLAATGDKLKKSVFFDVPTFVASNLESDLGHGVGWPAAGLVLAGSLVAWLLLRSVVLARRHPAVLAAATGAIVFYMLAALGRDRISATESPSRYAYIGWALLLPAVAVVLSALPTWASRVENGRLARLRHGRAEGANEAVGAPWPGKLTTVVAIALAAMLFFATASNISNALSFVRPRTVFVRGLGAQVVTSAYLLQSPEQMARSINRYPVWASGFASGYLTPLVLADLWRQHLVPTPSPKLMTSVNVLTDESWLDLSVKHRRVFRGSFVIARLSVPQPSGQRPARQLGAPGTVPAGLVRLTGAAWLGVVFARPVAEQPRWSRGWPRGPGLCRMSTPFGTPTRAGVVSLALAGGTASGSVWLSIGPRGGRVRIYLSHVWGFRGPRGKGQVRGEILAVPSGGSVWLNDSAPHDGFVLALGPRQRAELCALAPSVAR